MNTILFVDDDRILRKRVADMFTLFADQFKTLTAGDGVEALDMLGKTDISLVVADLKMPRKDGFALLAHLSQYYPDVPVIAVTAHSPSAARKLALKKGAAGFLAKPFELEELGRKIQQTLLGVTEGGTLNSISLELFSQLIEMEMKTCTLRVIEKKGGGMGVLFFREGVLMDARLKNVQGKVAALKIFGWEDVSLSLQEKCPVTKKKIDSELQAVVMDAIRLRDEGVDPTEGYLLQSAAKPKAVGKPEEQVSEIDRVREKISNIPGSERWLKTIVQDSRFDAFLAACSGVGQVLKAGEFKACYIYQRGHLGAIAVAGKETTVVSVDISCPWDAVKKALLR